MQFTFNHIVSPIFLNNLVSRKPTSLSSVRPSLTHSLDILTKMDLVLRARYFVRFIHICFLCLQMLASSCYGSKN